MNEQADEVFNVFNSRESFEDGILPPSQLTRRVDVVGLLVSSEVLLRESVEFNH